MAKLVIQLYLKDKSLLLCFRNHCLLILQTSRAACLNRASSGKDGRNPLITAGNTSSSLPSPWGRGVYEWRPSEKLFPEHKALTPHLLCLGSSLLKSWKQMLVSARIAAILGTRGPSCKTWHAAQFTAQNRVKQGISKGGREL